MREFSLRLCLRSAWLRCFGWRRIKNLGGGFSTSKGLSFSYYQPTWYRDIRGQRYYLGGTVRLNIVVDGRRLCRTMYGDRAAAVFNSLYQLACQTPSA